jgi:hypothetical protein
MKSARITSYSLPTKEIYSWHSYPDSHGEDYETITKMFEYFEELVVVAYKENPEGIFWELDGNWYDTDQIERIRKLKGFI